MSGFLRAEWIKATTTRMLFGLALGSIAYTLLSVFAITLLGPLDPATPDGLLLDPQYITLIIGSAGSSSVLILVLGIIGMTGEFRHQTVTPTFLAMPNRGSVLVGKSLVYGLLGAILAVINFVITLLATFVFLSFFEHAPIDWSTAFEILGGLILGFAVYAILGVAIGALLRNQVAAILISLVWILLIEALLTAFVSSIGKWLPGGALAAVLQATNPVLDSDLLPVFGGVIVLLGYALIFGGLALATTLRRDVT